MRSQSRFIARNLPVTVTNAGAELASEGLERRSGESESFSAGATGVGGSAEFRPKWSMAELKSILKDVEERLATEEGRGRDEHDPLRSSLRVVRSAVAMARGINNLRGTENEEPGMVLFRALYERVLDMHAIYSSADPERQVIKMRAAGILELIKQMESHEEHEEYLKASRMELETLREADSDAVTEVESQRNRGRWHWTGKSRNELESALPVQIRLYGPLSWLAHGTLGALLEYSGGIEEGLRTTTAVLIGVIWAYYADAAGIDRIDLEAHGLKLVEEAGER